jgi:hypothetical protein
MKVIAVAVCLCTLAGVARAEDEPKDPDTAFEWSLGGTIASAGVVGLGALLYVVNDPDAQNPVRLFKVPLHNWGSGLMMLGGLSSALTPAFGEFYSHEFWTRGMTLRLVGAAVAGLGAATLHPICIDPADFDCPAQPQTNGGSVVLIVAGASAYAGGIWYDLAHARDATHRYNREHAPHATVIPTMVHGATSTGYGVALSGAF